MRVRKQDINNDMLFGRSLVNFWHDQVDGVAQIIRTRLLLFRGEWFIDTTEGMPWGGFPINDLVVVQGQVLGKHTQSLRDMALKICILGTPNVTNIVNYVSSFNGNTRTFTASMIINTEFGRLEAVVGAAGDVGFILDISPLDTTGLF